MTTDKVIAAILEGGAGRLTIPGLGTFIRRGATTGDDLSGEARSGGTLVFMNILSGDDGVLTNAVARAMGEPEAAAKVRVEKYVTGLRNDLKEKHSATIEGVGTLLLTESGKYKFVPTEKAEKTEKAGKTEKTDAADALSVGGDAAIAQKHIPDIQKPSADEQKPLAEKRDAVKKTEKHDVAEKSERHDDAAKPEVPVRVSKTDPVNTNTAVRDVIPDGGPVIYKPNIGRTHRRKRLDPVILIAIIAILIGLIVIFYGRTVERDYNIDLNEIINTK